MYLSAVQYGFQIKWKFLIWVEAEIMHHVPANAILT